MSTEIIEGNKLIAEFMGVGKSVEHPILWFKPDTESYWISSEELRYNSSWDWLMPVWHKFRLLPAPVGLEGAILNVITRLAQDIAHEEIGVFFKNLVSAITWYNLQSKANSPKHELA